MTTDTNTAEGQAKAQLDSIKAMLERLEHARECTGVGFCRLQATPDFMPWDEYHDEDAANQALDEDPLSVLVRSGWYDTVESHHRFDRGDVALPEEYEILLCTGGPAVRIRGDLNQNCEPETARLEYQDWGTPWTEYHTDTSNTHCHLLAYAQHFYFGE